MIQWPTGTPVTFCISDPIGERLGTLYCSKNWGACKYAACDACGMDVLDQGWYTARDWILCALSLLSCFK